MENPEEGNNPKFTLCEEDAYVLARTKAKMEYIYRQLQSLCYERSDYKQKKDPWALLKSENDIATDSEKIDHIQDLIEEAVQQVHAIHSYNMITFRINEILEKEYGIKGKSLSEQFPDINIF